MFTLPQNFTPLTTAALVAVIATLYLIMMSINVYLPGIIILGAIVGYVVSHVQSQCTCPAPTQCPTANTSSPPPSS